MFVAEGRLVVRRLLESQRFSPRAILLTDAALEALIELLALESIEVNIFRGQNESGSRGRLFGGQVAAQAFAAAARTVEERSAHSLHGYFLRPLRPDHLPPLSR